MLKYEENLASRVNGSLQPLLGVKVTVKALNGLLASLYADDESTVLENPVTTDANGYFGFKAANGEYELTFSGAQIESAKRTIELYDADDEPPLTQAQAALPSAASRFGFQADGDGAQGRTIENKLRETSTVSDFDLPASAVRASAGKRLLVGAGETVTVNVPADFPTMQAAVDAISAWVIASSGSVTIKVADGTYVHTAGLTLNHPYGSRIRVVGNETTPANCVIQVATPGFDCITVSNGNVLGYINGFKLFKTAKAPFSDNTTGLLARSGASIHCGSKMVIDNWYYGIAARDGSYIYAPFASVDHAGDVGIWAFVGSTIDCPNAVSNNASDAGNGWGYGFQAEYGSALNCSNGSATGCNIGGIASLSNSNVRALGATASGNAGSGFLARDGGTIEAHNAIANSNTRYGIEEIGDSRVFGNSLTTTGNTILGKKPGAYFDNGSLGARLAADGDFRIDLNGANNWYFNSSGGLQLSIGHAASAANRAHFQGSAAGQPVRYQPAGNDTNIAAELASKGSEVVRMISNGRVAAQFYNSSASAVNYVQFNGATTGQPAEISAQGNDTVVDLALLPKGAGSYVKFGAGFSASSDVAIVGSITIRDSAGTLRKLAVIA